MACRGARRKLLRDERGATAVEYGFLAALVVLAVMFAIAEVGSTNYGIWRNVADKVTAAG